MTKFYSKNRPYKHINWEALLTSISDTDLDLLISANTKMERGEVVLSSSELEAYLRWQSHLESISTSPNKAI